MTSRQLRFLVLTCAALVLVAASGPRALLAQGKGTIKIATQSPLSGEQSDLGENIKLGAQLAVEKQKGALEKMGFKVELVPFDDQAKPDVGVSNAKNIISDKDILAIIGHLNSGVAIPSSEIYKEVNLAMADPKIKERIASLGGIALPGSPEDYGRTIAADTEKLVRVMSSASTPPETAIGIAKSTISVARMVFTAP